MIQDYKNHKNTTYDFSFQKSNIIAKSIYEAIIPRTYPFKSKAETKALIIEFFDGLDLDIDTKDEILYQYRQILNYIFQDRISDWIKSTKNETWCYQQLCTYLEKKGCVFIKK